MRWEENIYHGLHDLKSGLGTIKLDEDTHPGYKHVKHGMEKVIFGVGGPTKTKEIEVAPENSTKVLKYIAELECEKAKAEKEEGRRSKAKV